MRVFRSLKLPGKQEYESSGYEVELTPEDIGMKPPFSLPQLQMALHILSRESQLRVMTNALADGQLSQDEFTRRVSPFMSDKPPEWMLKRE